MILKHRVSRLLFAALFAVVFLPVAAQHPLPPPVTEIPAMEALVSERATAVARREFVLAEKDKIKRARFDGPTNLVAWPEAFWSAYIVGLDDEQRGQLFGMLRRELVEMSDKPVDYQRALLNAVYTLLPGQHRGIVASPMRSVKTEREFAMAAYAINQNSLIQARRTSARELMQVQFPDWHNDPVLTVLDHEMQFPWVKHVETRPALADLFAHPFQPGVPVVFSLQRVDRHQPGIVIVREASGRFHRTQEGTVFNVPQLALSRTNLPGTITYGNPPQGVYTIRGMGRATNPLVGPTPYLWSKLPQEATVAEFLHDEEMDPATPWTEEIYEQMLPASWHDYFPMREAWYAGRAGRSEIIAHGSTLDPDLFADRAHYPLTPTDGSLSTIELWDLKDGSLVYSDQLTLLKAFESSGGPNGYLVVVELDAQEKPVSITNVIADILKAEEKLASAAQ